MGDDERARPWLYVWSCTRCSAKQDFRAGDTLRYYLRGGPTCPLRREHGRMELVHRNLDERGPKRPKPTIWGLSP